MKKGFPNTFVIVGILILLAAAVTWVVPGAHPQTWQIFAALYNGFVRQAGIIVFILIVGGAFHILDDTGAVSYGIRRFIRKFGQYDRLFLTGITVLFSACGAIFGMSEETIPFVGIVVPMVISLGYDAVLGLMAVYVAAHVGFSAAFLNPFTVGIAQQMSELQMFSGMGYRIFCWTLLTGLLIAFELLYARRIKRPVGRMEAGASDDVGHEWRKVLILILFAVTVIALVIGSTCFGWYLPEISALFLAFGILTGIIGKSSANRIAETFVAGAGELLGAAIVVGLASGIVIILQDGGIIDLMFSSMRSSPGTGSRISDIGIMYGIVSLVNLILPSATAKAAMIVPILSRFADLSDISRQTMVLAFQFGDGFTNMITPTSGVLIAALGMAGIRYSDWFKMAFKWILVLIVIGFVLLLPTVFLPIQGY